MLNMIIRTQEQAQFEKNRKNFEVFLCPRFCFVFSAELLLDQTVTGETQDVNIAVQKILLDSISRKSCVTPSIIASNIL